MPIPTYTPGYPPDGSSLGQTKTVIRNNLDGTFETLNVDHVNNNGSPGSNPAGYHTIIHEVPQTSVTTVANYNQLFSGVPGVLAVDAVTTPAIPPTDTQLYSLTGTGVLSQLTGKLTGSGAGARGYAWIGGVLIQWGRKQSLTQGTVNFTDDGGVNFPNNCFSLTTSMWGNNSTATNLTTVAIFGVAASGFSFSFNGNSNNYSGFYWMAIGN